MSSDIWTRCEGASEVRPLRLEPWRVVEAQHLLSTRKLVDSDAEQIQLEQLIDRVKPPVPEAAPSSLHYLLLTPFRYPPLRHGSRFGTTTEPGIWYGSMSVFTALAESAYYRLVFIEGSGAELGTLRTKLTVYQVRLKADRGVDLSRAPFNTHALEISSPSEYGPPQTLGSAMRTDAVQAFQYVSARDPQQGINVGALDPAVFKGAKPKNLESWHSTADKEGVEFRKLDYFNRVVTRFNRDIFLVGGELPAPAP